MKCPACRKKTESLVCASCWSLTVDRLSKFPESYAVLEKELVPSQGYGERVGGSKTPPIPVKLEVLHLRTGGISQPLLKHESAIRAGQRHTRVTFRGENWRYVQESCKYLVIHKEWIWHNYKDIDNLVMDVVSINKAINNALGYRSELVTIGTCPATDENGEVCGYRLQVNPTTLSSFSDIICGSCKTTWSSTRWRLLGKMLDDDNLSRGDEVVQSKSSDPV